MSSEGFRFTPNPHALEAERKRRESLRSPEEKWRKVVDGLKNHPDYESIPLEIRGNLENTDGSLSEDVEVFHTAATKFLKYENMRRAAHLKESDMALLADSENPFKLGKFTKNQRLRLREIKEAVEEANKPLLQKLGFKYGEQVTVQRSSGDIEKDWTISGYRKVIETNEIFIEVKKPDPEKPDTTMRKEIPLEDFQKLNPR